MTQTPEEAGTAIHDEFVKPDKFDLASALNKVSYPTDNVTVYLDGYKAHELNLVFDLIAENEEKSERLSAQKNGTIADDPEKEAVDAEIEKLKAREQVLLAEITGSALTFKIRGVAPKVWRLMDKEARRTIKPASKSEEDVFEATLERNEFVNVRLLAKGTVSITDAHGNVDAGALSIENAQTIFDSLIEPEYYKLKTAIENVTFAHTLFQNVTLQDADFLSKSSAAPASQATSV